jgi:hypothetical protein
MQAGSQGVCDIDPMTAFSSMRCFLRMLLWMAEVSMPERQKSQGFP